MQHGDERPAVPVVAPRASIPAPKSVPVGDFARLMWRHRSDPTRISFILQERYGADVVRVWAGANVWVIFDPRDVAFVLRRAPTNKHTPIWDLAQYVVGDGVLVAHGDAWSAQRQAGNQLLTDAARRRVREVALHNSLLMLESDRWRPGAHVDLFPEMQTLTLQILIHTLFGAPIPHQEACLIAADVKRVIHRFAHPIAMMIPSWIPIRSNARYWHTLFRLEGALAHLAGSRGAPDSELGQTLLDGAMEGSRCPVPHNLRGGWDTLQVEANNAVRRIVGRLARIFGRVPPLAWPERNELLTYLIAGHETTASAITWAVFLTATHGFSERATEPAFAESLVNEAMRLYPPLWGTSRRVAEPFELASGHRLERGDWVLISIYHQNRDPRWWDAPNAFRPERFAGGTRVLSPEARAAFIPFGVGPRACLGRHFAMEEAIAAVSSIFAHRRLAYHPPFPALDAGMRPVERLDMRVEARLTPARS